MQRITPGTLLPFPESSKDDAFSVIGPILDATKGLTLAQLCEITGLNATTIQNWVKRGWVMNPVDKRYHEVQVARILLINLLRGSMQLDNIVTLMAYVNGAVDDRSDDIIPDKLLYNYLCSIIVEIESLDTMNTETIKYAVKQKIKEYKVPFEGAEVILLKALYTMTLAYLASDLKQLSELEFYNLKENLS